MTRQTTAQPENLDLKMHQQDGGQQSKPVGSIESKLCLNLELLPEACRHSIIVLGYACSVLDKKVVQDFASDASLAPLCVYVKAHHAYTIDTRAIRRVRKRVSKLLHSDKSGQHSETYSRFNSRVDVCIKLPSAQDWTKEHEALLFGVEV